MGDFFEPGTWTRLGFTIVVIAVLIGLSVGLNHLLEASPVPPPPTPVPSPFASASIDADDMPLDAIQTCPSIVDDVINLSGQQSADNAHISAVTGLSTVSDDQATAEDAHTTSVTVLVCRGHAYSDKGQREITFGIKFDASDTAFVYYEAVGAE